MEKIQVFSDNFRLFTTLGLTVNYIIKSADSLIGQLDEREYYSLLAQPINSQSLSSRDNYSGDKNADIFSQKHLLWHLIRTNLREVILETTSKLSWRINLFHTLG